MYFEKAKHRKHLAHAHILLTNDDGYQAEGLAALAAAWKDLPRCIVEPSLERSGAVQSLTLRQRSVQPDRERMGHRRDAGDCVIVAPCTNFCRKRPDDGDFRNQHGANLGENVYYSGTVGRRVRARCITSILANVAWLEKNRK